MKAKILLVDDNEDFLDSTRDVLEGEGYEVVTANNGEDALHLSQRDPFDVVLMDIKMPRMNGVESFVKMKADRPRIRVILFTAYSLNELVQKAKERGAVAVLNKPLDLKQLLNTIESAIKQRIQDCILVVDDDVEFCDSLVDLLEGAGYKVAVVSGGRQAVNRARDEAFDVLLLDMKLPDLNGLETYRVVKQLQPSIITIIVSGYVDEMRELIGQCLSESAYTCLRKPLDMRTLLEMLKEIYAAKAESRFDKSK